MVRRRGLHVVADQHHELVATIARAGLAAAQDVAQAPRHFLQHPVAHQMAVAVVDRLEAIQVDHQHGQVGAGPFGARHGGGHFIVQRRAVGQAGEQVAGGQVLHALLGMQEARARAGQAAPEKGPEQPAAHQQPGPEQCIAAAQCADLVPGGGHRGFAEVGDGLLQQAGLLTVTVALEDLARDVGRAHGHRLEGRLAHVFQFGGRTARLAVEALDGVGRRQAASLGLQALELEPLPVEALHPARLAGDHGHLGGRGPLQVHQAHGPGHAQRLGVAARGGLLGRAGQPALADQHGKQDRRTHQHHAQGAASLAHGLPDDRRRGEQVARRIGRLGGRPRVAAVRGRGVGGV